MKKILFCILFLCSFAYAYADRKKVYCEIVGTSTSLLGGDEVVISLDFGQPRKLFQSQMLVDELGAAIEFNSMIDALNWMGELGWEFEQAYTVSDELSKQKVYHFLLSKYLEDNDRIDKGIHLASQMKNPSEEGKAEMAKREENKAYIALIMKTQKFDSKYKDEVSKIFPFNEILQLIQTKSEDELKALSKKHSTYFNKYEIYE